MAELEDAEKPSIEELLSALLIQSMRNYDLLIHLLALKDKEGADKLYDLHEKFGLYGPMPFPVFEE